MFTVLKVIFWFSAFFVFYTYFGYPILLIIIAKIKGKAVDKDAFTPSVTMLIAAYNEENNIRNKLENALSMNYPKDKFEIVVVSDHSSDKTDEIVKNFNPFGVKLLRMPERGGKSAALNYAITKANGKIIVLSDSRQLYDRNAIIELVNNFNDKKVGAVSGELYLINKDKGGVGEGVGAYWKYEKLLRKKRKSNIFNFRCYRGNLCHKERIISANTG
ncbi:glycosyltransferase [Candidatus Poribacteria bacterium]|nr:glycosyltransferase [Candidatus Poribacteria bacterium]